MIRDVIFISRGNETFSQHHVRRLAAGWHVSVLAAAFCSVWHFLQSTGTTADLEWGFLVELLKKFCSETEQRAALGALNRKSFVF